MFAARALAASFIAACAAVAAWPDARKAAPIKRADPGAV
jgi:hypothetical protein